MEVVVRLEVMRADFCVGEISTPAGKLLPLLADLGPLDWVAVETEAHSPTTFPVAVAAPFDGAIHDAVAKR